MCCTIRAARKNFTDKPQTDKDVEVHVKLKMCKRHTQDELCNHQGMLLPSQSKRVPLSFSVMLVMTFIIPLMLSAVVR